MLADGGLNGVGSLTGQLTPGGSGATQVDPGPAQTNSAQTNSAQTNSTQTNSAQTNSTQTNSTQTSEQASASPSTLGETGAATLEASAAPTGVGIALSANGAIARPGARPGEENGATELSTASESDGLTQVDTTPVKAGLTPLVATDSGVRFSSSARRAGSSGSDPAPQRSATPSAADVFVLDQTSGGASPATPQTVSPSSAPQDSAAGPVATAQTFSGLALQTAAAVNGGGSQFQIELHPEDLGRVDVSVRIGASGQLNAEFAFEKPQAAAELSARSGELKHALEQAGFGVADAGLSFSVASLAQQPSAPAATAHLAGGHLPGQGFSQGQPQGQGQGQGQGSGQQHWGGTGRASGQAFAAAAQTAAAADQLTTTAYASHAERGLDIRI